MSDRMTSRPAPKGWSLNDLAHYRPNMRFESDRECPVCRQKLSRYNPGPCCYLHTEDQIEPERIYAPEEREDLGAFLREHFGTIMAAQKAIGVARTYMFDVIGGRKPYSGQLRHRIEEAIAAGGGE